MCRTSRASSTRSMPRCMAYPSRSSLLRHRGTWGRRSVSCPMLVSLHAEWGGEARRIYQAILPARGGEGRTGPILADPHAMGSTEGVEFDTLKRVIVVKRSPPNRLVIDSGWEEKVGQVL